MKMGAAEFRAALIAFFHFCHSFHLFESTTCQDGCSCDDVTRHVTCRKLDWIELPRNFARGAKVVDVSENRMNFLTSMELERAGMQEVIKLNLSQNEIEKVVDGAFAVISSSLQGIDLSRNNLTELGLNSFHSCRYLKSVDISHNNLKSIEAVFNGLRDLSRLELQWNKISELTQSTFKDLVNLIYLNLAQNKIAKLDKKTFKPLGKLMFLFLNGNPIADLERLQFNSYFLSDVDFFSCKLRQVPRGLPNSIKFLQMGNNDLKIIDRTTFQDCPYITILILDRNAITDIEAGSFNKMFYLQRLWLNHNSLTRLPSRIPDTLENLSLESNRIHRLDGNSLPPDSKLSILILGGNLIAEIESGFFSKLRELFHLDLSDNKISRIATGTFEMNEKLQILRLSKNPLLVLEPGCLRGLSQMSQLFLADIRDSSSLSIGNDFFEYTRNLSTLDLQGSPAAVRAVINSEHHLEQLNSLRNLNMANSQLSSLRPDFPKFFPNLEYFHLSSNRWLCDESILWLKEAISNEVMDLQAAELNICYAPLHLKGMAVLNLAEEDILDASQRNVHVKKHRMFSAFTFKQRNFQSSPRQENEKIFEGGDNYFTPLMMIKYISLEPNRTEGGHHDVGNTSNSNSLKPKENYYFVQRGATNLFEKKDSIKSEAPLRKDKVINILEKHSLRFHGAQSTNQPHLHSNLLSTGSKFLSDMDEIVQFNTSYYFYGVISMILLVVLMTLVLVLFCFFSNSKSSSRNGRSFARHFFILRQFLKRRKRTRNESNENKELRCIPVETSNRQDRQVTSASEETCIALIPSREVGAKRVYSWIDF